MSQTDREDEKQEEEIQLVDPSCTQCGMDVLVDSVFCQNCGTRSYYSASFRMATGLSPEPPTLALPSFCPVESGEREYVAWTIEADDYLSRLGINCSGTTLKTSVRTSLDLIYQIYSVIEDASHKFGRPLGSLNLHRRIYKSLLLVGKFTLALRIGGMASILGARCYSTQAEYALMLMRHSPSDKSEEVFQKAMNMLVERAEEEHSDPEVHATLGALIASTFNWDEDQSAASVPIKCFDRSLKIDGAYLPSFLGRAMVKIEVGDFGGALAELAICLILAPNSPEHLVVRGMAYTRMGETRKAINAYNKVMQLDSLDTWTLNNRAACHLEAGDSSSAKRDMRRSIEIDPYFTLPYNNLANLQLLEGNLPGAIKTLSKAVSTSPACALSFLNLSRLKAKSGDVDGALSDLVHSMRLAPKSWDLEVEYSELVDRLNNVESNTGEGS